MRTIVRMGAPVTENKEGLRSECLFVLNPAMIELTALKGIQGLEEARIVAG